MSRNTSGSPRPSHDGVAGGPLADAGKRDEALHELLPIGAGVERDRTVGDGRREPGDRATTRPRHRQRAGIERGESIGRREHVGEPVVGNGQQVTGRLDDAGGDGAGAGDRHLLADHAAHRDLERVDGARGASPWRLGDERLEDRIVTEHGIDGDRVGVEVEEPAETLDGRGQIAPVGERQLGANIRLTGLEHRDAVPVRQRERAVVSRRRRRARRPGSRAIARNSNASRPANGPRVGRRTTTAPGSAGASPIDERRRSSVGASAYTSRTVSLNWRTLPKPAANAMSVIDIDDVSISTRAVCARWARASASGPAPSSSVTRRVRWRLL